MKKFAKKAVAVVMAVIMVVAVTQFTDRDSEESATPLIQSFTRQALATTDFAARDGYILAPTMYGTSGVDTLSSFTLQTPTDYAENPKITIDGLNAPTITRTDNRTFTITPVIPLNHNSVYVFRLENGVSWTFQTARKLEITGTLPRNEATNVPVRTGIEISFSFGDAPDISEHFSIYPHVEGRFTSRDSTAIFVPLSPLEHETIYTVTIKEGIELAGTSDSTGQPAMFAFETEAAPNATTVTRWPSGVNFMSVYAEFPSFAQAEATYWLTYNRMEDKRPSIEFNLYRLDDRETAINTVTSRVSSHWWSNRSQREHLIDTSDLEKIFTQTVTQSPNTDWWSETFTFPESLPQGFYVLDAKTNEENSGNSQIIVQITDIAAQVVGDSEKTILWINNMHTGTPVNASVYDAVRDTRTRVEDSGIAIIGREMSSGEYLVVEAGDLGGVIFIQSNDWGRRSYGGWWGFPSVSDKYWSVLQLDRSLFQRNDTVNIWGFVQNRHENENINFVTVELTEGYRWGRGFGGDFNSERDTLHKENITVRNGSYTGEIILPHVDPGSYMLNVYHGDILLSSTYISVEDYVKPPYQLNAAASHAAVFAGEEITFTASTEFFEGTPVPDLSLSYSYWGYEVLPESQRSHTGTTDSDGKYEASVTPRATKSDVQGERSVVFSAEATLPEIGRTFSSSSVRVFVNDIDVSANASRTNENATLTVDVNTITLDRLNNGTHEHWGDYLDKPVQGKNISVEIAEIYWESVPSGEFYCHVTRQNVTRYRYVRRENILQTFSISTDAEGRATKEFTVPNTLRRSYQARLTTTDGNGRTIKHDVFIGRDFSDFYFNAEENALYLDGVNNEGYDIGDEVELTVMRGADKVETGSLLYVIVQDGIQDVRIGTNPFKFTFTEEHAPNIAIYAYHFNGHTFNAGENTWGMIQWLRYNPKNRELLIQVTPDKDAYRPGETPVLTVKTTDANGNPKAANINISLVDEALFSLMDYTVDTLEALYRRIDTNLRINFNTHGTFESDGMLYGARSTTADEAAGSPGAVSNDMVMAAPESMEMQWSATLTMDDSAGADNTRLRERFEDTAMFTSVRTDATGTATISFPLPDNITSWRVTASGISDDLYAGNSLQNVRVSLPMFLHYTLNKIFLTGDIPTIGVNAYGTSLSGGETVEFSVWRESAPEDVRTATGAAFERVNIPLWEKTEEGHDAVLIKANVLTFSDAVKHEYQVVSSHRLIDTSVFYEEVTKDTVFDINETGLTNITFTNYGRGVFLNELLRLRHTWYSGARIEGLVARREASTLIRKYFPDVKLFDETTDFAVTDYQTEKGGLAVLPYSSEELPVTVLLLPFVKDEINTHTLSNYLREILIDSATENKMLALYGLALLGEPVLLELESYANLKDLSLRDSAYIALSYIALGDTFTARQIYNERITEHIQAIDTGRLYRVNDGATQSEIWDTTTVITLLASQLGKPEALGLYNYVTNERPAIIWRNGRPDSKQLNAAMLLNLERLNFIANEIENYSDEPASITYKLFGETVTRDLGHNNTFTLRIPAQNMHQFELTSVTGDVGAVSIVRVPLENSTPVENNLSVTRTFFQSGSTTPATTFKQDELVRIQITVGYSDTDLSGTYVITDFLPAGLAHVANSARIDNTPSALRGSRAWARAEGQRVTFFEHRGNSNRSHTYHYYARVINPGTFTAEGTMVQSMGARDFMTVGENVKIVVE